LGTALIAVALQSCSATDLSIVTAGAVGDGKTLNTKAIQGAINQLESQGGGTLVIPSGQFLTGALFLKPKINVSIDADGVLLGSTNILDYPEMPTRIEGHETVWIPALLNAAWCDNLEITGSGTIQGGGQPYWDAFYNARKVSSATKNLDVKRPRNIFISDSKNVLLKGIKLRGSGFWNLHLYRDQNVTVESVDIREPHAPSTDGIDVDSCQDVTIHGCYISDNDDNIAVKGSKGPTADTDTTSPPDAHIHISDCTFGHGNGILTLGSEATYVHDVTVDNCKIEGTETNHVLTVKLRPDTPQHYEDIHVSNIVDNAPGTMINLAPWIQYFDLGGHAPPTQTAENITISNVTGSTTGFGRIAGPDKSVVRNITISNVDLKVSKPGADIKNVQGLKLDNVKLNGVALTEPDQGAAAPSPAD